MTSGFFNVRKELGMIVFICNNKQENITFCIRNQKERIYEILYP